MTFISYAQNFEDVMLCRALKNVERGFYIDVGAWSPVTDSVTCAFYERGWCGINIEPNSEFFSQLLDRRSRDINLDFCIGNHNGRGEIIIFDNPGLSTMDENIAKAHLDADHSAMRQEVHVVTLKYICENYLPAGQPIHFLKVDVEGYEEKVIRGNDWWSFRPWIVVVEATVPMSQTESHESWESILEDSDYRFCYSDGLNRFYLAQEHAELVCAFDHPPNVFDDFMTYAHSCAEAKAVEVEEHRRRAERLQVDMEENRNKVEQLQVDTEEYRMRVEQLKTDTEEYRRISEQMQTELQAVYASYTWCVTWPLRKMEVLIKWLLRRG